MTTGIHWYAEQFSGRSKCIVLSVSNPVLRPPAFLLHGQQHDFEWVLVCSHVTIQRSSTITNLVLKATEHNKKRNGKIKLDLCCMLKRFPCASTNIRFVGYKTKQCTFPRTNNINSKHQSSSLKTHTLFIYNIKVNVFYKMFPF